MYVNYFITPFKLLYYTIESPTRVFICVFLLLYLPPQDLFYSHLYVCDNLCWVVIQYVYSRRFGSHAKWSVFLKYNTLLNICDLLCLWPRFSVGCNLIPFIPCCLGTVCDQYINMSNNLSTNCCQLACHSESTWLHTCHSLTVLFVILSFCSHVC